MREKEKKKLLTELNILIGRYNIITLDLRSGKNIDLNIVKELDEQKEDLMRRISEKNKQPL